MSRMPRYILHHEETGLFLEYSTIVDAPVSTAAPYDEFLEFMCHEYGHHDVESHKARLERARVKGCSSHDPTEDLRSAIICNRAGRDETEMSFEQFVKHYFIDRGGMESSDERPVGEVKRDEE